MRTWIDVVAALHNTCYTSIAFVLCAALGVNRHSAVCLCCCVSLSAKVYDGHGVVFRVQR